MDCGGKVAGCKEIANKDGSTGIASQNGDGISSPMLVNNHQIRYNEMFDEWQVSYAPPDKNDPDYGYPAGEFKNLEDAIREAKGGLSNPKSTTESAVQDKHKKDKVAEIKKMEDGKISVRWEGDENFYPIPDDEIAEYLIYTMVHTPEEVFGNINSRLR